MPIENIRTIDKQGPEQTTQAMVRDPLERIIEGANRHERFKTFHANYLGHIWPIDVRKGASPSDYAVDMHAVSRLHAGDISGYQEFSPNALNPRTLSASTFEIVVQNLGTPDYVRVVSVPPQLTEPISVVPTGGSCIVAETSGMRTMSQLEKAEEPLIHEPTGQPMTTYVADRLIAMAPTITHLSGAVGSGQDVTIHYEETGMWTAKAKQWGVENAEGKVGAAYRRAHEAIQRRASLINPDAVVVPLDFDELPLGEAIGEWFTEHGLEYRPEYRVAEVVYTYKGPKLLEHVQAALIRRLEMDNVPVVVREKLSAILMATHILRIKQNDHLEWGKEMKLPLDVITGGRPLTPEEVADQSDPYFFETATGLMKVIHDTDPTSTSLLVGMLDLPGYNGTIQHQDRKMGVDFTGQPNDKDTTAYLASIEASLDNPRRLHNNNVEEHLAFLTGYLQAEDPTRRLDLIQQKGPLIGKRAEKGKAVKKLDGEIRGLHGTSDTLMKKLHDEMEAHALMEYMITVSDQPPTEAQQARAHRMRSKMAAEMLTLRTKANEGSITDNEQAELTQLEAVKVAFDAVSDGEKPVLLDAVHEYIVGMAEESSRIVIEEIPTRQAEIAQTIELKTREQEESQREWEILEADAAALDELIAQEKLPSPFPLAENPYIQHAMQFLWDSDFVAFMKHSVDLDKTFATDEKKTDPYVRADYHNKMRALMATVHQKLEAYVLYMYGRTQEYPAIRDVRLFPDVHSNGHQANGFEHNGHMNGNYNGLVAETEELAYNQAEVQSN